jgi:hypothetical protein
MAVFFLLLAIMGGIVLADLVRENPTAAEVTVFNQPVSGHSEGWLLAMAAALGVVTTLLLGSFGSTKKRRGRRRQLRALRTSLRRQQREADRDHANADLRLDDFLSRPDSQARTIDPDHQPPA